VKHASSDGVSLAYEELGSGDPVLFIQGLGYDRNGFGPLPHLLASDFRVIVFDNRGVGDSDVPEGPYSVTQLATDAVAVMDAAGVESAHVLGVSLGGFIAQELALARPERVRKLVLCSTAPGSVPPSFPMPERGIEAFSRFPEMEREAGLRLMVENSLGDHGVRERPELVEEIFRYRLERAPSLAGWQAQAYAGATFDAFARIPDIAAPTLVIHAEADTVVDARNGELLAERIPNASLHLVPERGHLVMWQESEMLAPIVREFLQA
jgi:pimeloyl-ACP methyl ester carboxylesterase